MTFDELGLSFLPRYDNGDRSGPTGGRLEDIIRILSLRLPRVLGARPVAPQALLTSSGADPLGSGIARGVVDSVLRGSPSVHNDPGAPSPLSTYLSPIYGPSAPSSPGQIPAPGPPRINTSEPPADDPGADRQPFERAYDDVGDQLRRGARRWS
jgi:hypothetical protein